MTLHARPSLAQPFCAVRSYAAGVGYATYCGGRFEVAVDVALDPSERCGGCRRRAASVQILGPVHQASVAGTLQPDAHPLDRHCPILDEPDPPSDSDTPPDDFAEMTVEGLGAEAVVPASLAELEQAFDRLRGPDAGPTEEP